MGLARRRGQRQPDGWRLPETKTMQGLDADPLDRARIGWTDSRWASRPDSPGARRVDVPSDQSAAFLLQTPPPPRRGQHKANSRTPASRGRGDTAQGSQHRHRHWIDFTAGKAKRTTARRADKNSTPIPGPETQPRPGLKIPMSNSSPVRPNGLITMHTSRLSVHGSWGCSAGKRVGVILILLPGDRHHHANWNVDGDPHRDHQLADLVDKQEDNLHYLRAEVQDRAETEGRIINEMPPD